MTVGKDKERWKCPSCGFRSSTKAGVNRHRSWKVGDGEHEDPQMSKKEPKRI